MKNILVTLTMFFSYLELGAQIRTDSLCNGFSLSMKEDTSFWHLHVHDWITKIASSKPPTSGGTVILASSSQGLALVVMSLEISARREKTPYG